MRCWWEGDTEINGTDQRTQNTYQEQPLVLTKVQKHFKKEEQTAVEQMVVERLDIHRQNDEPQSKPHNLHKN